MHNNDVISNITSFESSIFVSTFKNMDQLYLCFKISSGYGGGDLQSRGGVFGSQHRIWMDIFHNIGIAVKIVMFVSKRQKNEKEGPKWNI